MHRRMRKEVAWEHWNVDEVGWSKFKGGINGKRNRQVEIHDLAVRQSRSMQSTCGFNERTYRLPCAPDTGAVLVLSIRH